MKILHIIGETAWLGIIFVYIFFIRNYEKEKSAHLNDFILMVVTLFGCALIARFTR